MFFPMFHVPCACSFLVARFTGGNSMEKNALEALDCVLISGDKVASMHPQAAAALELTI